MMNRRQILQSTAAIGAMAMAMKGRRSLAQGTPWRHAIVQAKADAGFFFIAKEKGFWEQQGLDVEIVELKGSKDVIRALLAGEADSSDSIPADIIPAWEKGADVRVIGSTIIGYPYAMYVRKDINDWSELADKTFGVSSPGSAPHMFALAMLQTAGVPTDNIKIANAGGTTGRIKALAAGTLDATAASTEFIPDADALGIKVLGEAQDMAPEFPRFVLTMAGDTVDTRADDAARFAAGYIQGLRYAVEHRDEIIALSAKRLDADPSDSRFAYAYDEIVNNNMISLDMSMPIEKIDWMQNMMLWLGEIKEKIPFERYLAPQIRDKALSLVDQV